MSKTHILGPADLRAAFPTIVAAHVAAKLKDIKATAAAKRRVAAARREMAALRTRIGK